MEVAVHGSDDDLAVLLVSGGGKLRFENRNRGGHGAGGQQHLRDEGVARGHATADVRHGGDQAAVEDFGGREAPREQCRDVVLDDVLPAFQDVVAQFGVDVVGKRGGGLLILLRLRRRYRGRAEIVDLERQRTLALHPVVKPLQTGKDGVGRHVVGHAEHDAFARRDHAEQFVHVGFELGVAGLRQGDDRRDATAQREMPTPAPVVLRQ